MNSGTAQSDWGRNIRRHWDCHPISGRDHAGCSVGRYSASNNRTVHPFVVPVIMVVVMMMVVFVMTVMIVFRMGSGHLVGVVPCRL